MLSQRQWSKWRLFLLPVALLYWGLSWWRNFFYNVNFFISRRVSVPVISIGNLSMGGTGKTPATLFVAQTLIDLGYRVGIVSRGYGRATSGTVLVSDDEQVLATFQSGGDEPHLMATRLKGVPVLVDEDRYRGATYLVERFHPDVLILDDGFQHRGLARDCDIVLLDATAPSSDYNIFPYGLLRERLQALKRANLVVWTKTQIRVPQKELQRRIATLGIPQIQSTMEVIPELIEVGTGQRLPAGQLAGKRLLAFCGIAQPRPFYHALFALGLEPELVRYYPDHHHYTPADLVQLSQLIREHQLVGVTTEKDAVKLPAAFIDEHRIYALRIEFNLTGEDRKIFQETLLRCLPIPQASPTVGEA
ncbi:MAG: tetraacyldisaccharide 4'-kinase [Candidatus Marinimicrobia bacterium]|nr:tetraacyldisaccharide 4'-kinase [Candidatus Neomarinimicrobiota bacterium]